MRFGSEEVAALIEANIADEENVEWLMELLAIVQKDAEKLLARKVADIRDREEIIQDVKLRVLQHLPEYYRNIPNYEERQRNAWLRKIVESRLRDFYRKCARTFQADVSLDEMWEIADGDSEREQRRLEVRVGVYEALRNLGEIDTTPDKCLAFLLNRLSSVATGGNGKPKMIAEEMEGKELAEVFDEVKKQLSAVLGEDIPGSVLEPLLNKILPVGKQPFRLDAKTIRDSSNWISSKYRKNNKYRSDS